jgi:MoaA/NifB/PqqE/SkfB family radical SAM enzyme
MSIILKNNLYRKVQAVLSYPRIAASMIYRMGLYKMYNYNRLHNGRALTLPCELVFILSRKCFLDCATCGTRALYGSDDMFADFIELDHMKKVADELATWHSPKYVKLTGGEASMHPEFIEILNYYGHKKIPVRLSSNGLRFVSKERANALVDAGVDVITISIDGFSEDHNTIRKSKNLYNSLTRAISNINERKRQLKTNKPMIQIASIISKTNYKRLPEFVRELEKVGIDWLHFGFIEYTNNEIGMKSQQVCKDLGGLGDDKWKFWRDNPLPNLEVEPDVIEENFKTIFSEPHSFPISMLNIGGTTSEHFKKYHFSDDWIHTELCSTPYFSMDIVAPGLATFCIDFPQFYYGDIRENSIRDIWFSSKAQSFRKKFLNYYRENGENMPHCLRCVWRFW